MSRFYKVSIVFVFLLVVFLGAAQTVSVTAALADLPTPTPPACMTVQDAVAQGLVRLTLTGNGNLFYKKPVHYTIENLTSGPLTICFPVGLILQSVGGGEQSLVLPATVIIDLAAGEIKEGDLATFCINEHKSAPSEGAGYQLGQMAEGSLLNLAYVIDADSAQGHLGAQLAVWAVTDAFNLANMDAPPSEGEPLMNESFKSLLCLAQDEVGLGQQLLQEADTGVSLYQVENPLTGYCEARGVPSFGNILQRLKIIGIGAAIAIGAGGLACIAVIVLVIVLVVRMIRKKK